MKKIFYFSGNKTNRHIVLSASAGCMLMAGAFLSSCSHKESNEGEGTPDIEVAEALTDSIVIHQVIPGTVLAADKADVVAQVTGKILTKNYKSGAYVKAGQVLFTIDPTKYRDAVSQAEASLTTARSQYDYAKAQYAAMKKALEADAVSRMEVLQAEANMEQAQAAIQNAQASLSTARLNLSHCNVKAPIDGIVTSSSYDAGQFVNGDGAPVTLCTVYNNATLKARFSLSEDQYNSLVAANGGIGADIYRNVPITFRQPTKKDYMVNLNYEAPTVSSSTGTMILQGDIINSENELRDGMYVSISLPTGVRPHAVLVKDASIGSDQLGSYMYLVNDSNKVAYTPVTTGELYQDSLRVIEKGVKTGDRYVTKALLTVRAGEKINPVGPGSKNVKKANAANRQAANKNQ